MMGDEVFPLHVAIPTYATRPVSLYKADTRQAQQCRLFLQLLNKVFFPGWCLTGSPFPVGALQISYFKILPCNQTKWSLFTKHINWVEYHQMTITAKYARRFTGSRENAI